MRTKGNEQGLSQKVLSEVIEHIEDGWETVHKENILWKRFYSPSGTFSFYDMLNYFNYSIILSSKHFLFSIILSAKS